jgi:chromatin remodeling complex protein RSC6
MTKNSESQTPSIKEDTSKKSDIQNQIDLELDKAAEQFGGILQTLSSFKSQITMLQTQVRSLEKTVNKKVRQLKKEAKKNKNKGNRKPSGFARPTPISKDLCEFMGKEEGTEVARTEVTKYIVGYIKEKNLQAKDNSKVIKPDEKLKNLLGVESDDEVTYFNIQKYMNKHFIKKNKKINGKH